MLTNFLCESIIPSSGVKKNEITLLIAFCLIIGWGLFALVIVTIACNLFAVFYKIGYAHRIINLKINWRFFNLKLIKEVFGYSMWITVIQVAQRFFVGIIPTILGIVSGSRAIAIFGIASTLESYGFAFSRAFINMYLPHVTKVMLNKDGDNELLKLMIKVGRIQSYIIGLIIVGFICVGKEFIILWVGLKYEEAFLCVILLFLPIFFTQTQGIVELAMQVKNEIKWQSLVYCISAIVNVVIAFILGKFYGAIGACIGLVSAETCMVVLLNIVYQKKIGINVAEFFKKTFLSLIIPFGTTCVFALFIVSKIPSGSWGWFLIKTGLICIVYLILIWFLSMNEYEKNMVFTAVKKISKLKGSAKA